MHALEKILLEKEEWLMQRILEYATRHDYVQYTSTLLEAWRLSISGLTKALIVGLADWPDIRELGPDDDYADDPVTEFGVTEAKRHRERGISFSMFMGLFKYYRQTYHDLLSTLPIPTPERSAYHAFLRRCFDRIEIAFANQWIALSDETYVSELQARNRELVNEKNLLVTLMESVESPIIYFNRDLAAEYANTAFIKRFLPMEQQRNYYYDNPDRERAASYHGLGEDVPWTRELIEEFTESEHLNRSRTISLPLGETTAHFVINASRLRDVSGKYTGTVLVLNDVTTQKETLRLARDHERKFKTILETTPLPLAITSSITGRTLYANQQLADVLGIALDQTVGLDAKTFYVNPNQRHEVIQTIQRTGEARGVELEMLDTRGKRFWASLTGVAVHYEEEQAYLFLIQDITERRLVQEERRKLLQAVDKSPASVVVTDAGGRMEYVNEKFCSVSGYARGEALGRNPRILKSGKQPPEVYADLWQTISSGREWRGELCNKGKHGREYWESVSISPIADDDGTITHYIALKEDITDRRQAANDLRRSEERFRSLIHNLHAGVIVHGPDTAVELCNPMAARLLGMDQEDMIGKTASDDCWRFIHEDRSPLAAESHPAMQMLSRSEEIRGLVLGVNKNNEEDPIWVRLHAFNEYHADGSLKNIVIHFWNVTALKRTADALRASEEHSRLVFDTANVGMCLVSKSGRLLRVNKTFESMFGYDQEELLGRHFNDITHEDDQTIGSTFMRRAAEGKADSLSLEKRYRHKDGTFLFCYITIRVMRDDSGEVDFLITTVLDISVRKKAEQALRESEQFQRLLLRSIGAGVITVSPDGLTVESINTRAAELIGVDPEWIVGQSINELCWQNFDGQCTLGLPQEHNLPVEEFILIRPDGSRLPVTRTTVKAVVKGEERFVLVIFDITDRKALERQLNLAQKLEAIGSLAAGIAHEINTPVQYISSNMSYLEKAFETIAENLAQCRKEAACPQGEGEGGGGEVCTTLKQLNETMEEIPEAISDCQEGISRVSEIVLSMRKFSHPDTDDDPRPVDINAAIQNTVTISRNEWKYVAEVTMNLDEDVPPIRCAAGDCNQVLLNIVVNAAHAIGSVVEGTGDKGLITISTRASNGFVEVLVKDTGGGIPPEIQDKIFDPFFTTKEVGRGTGQGLAITHSILERYSGTISFTSEVGKGTVFTIRFAEFSA